jgi:hypothetical protein
MNPPTEYQWDDMLKDVIHDVFDFSADLEGSLPKLVANHGRLVLNYSETALSAPQNQSVVYVRASLRPVRPATMIPTEAEAEDLDWYSITIGETLLHFFTPSADLVGLSTPPRCIMMYGDRLQVNWQLSSAPEPQNQSIVDLYFTCRPVAPATIVYTPRPAYA